jgi:hypothetical protein
MIEKRLLNYTAAATAGLAFSTLAQPAEAKVVFTPVHRSILPEIGLRLDLNHDGVTDFFLYNFWFDSHHSYNSSIGFLSVRGSAGVNRVITETSQNGVGFAKALPAGVTVGPSANFGPYFENRMLECGTTSYVRKHRSGPWLDVKNKYLGLKFIVNGEIHYGWARFTTQQVTYCKVRALLSGYAYESDANTPIVTGQTSDSSPVEQKPEAEVWNHDDMVPSPSLAALSLGAFGPQVWRKEEQP